MAGVRDTLRTSIPTTRSAPRSRYLSTSTPFQSDDFKYNAPCNRPLSGITIVALEQVISMPLATRHLAELGARVIKIERPGTGDFVRHHDSRIRGKLCSHFAWTNRSKESLALDIKDPQDMDVLKTLVCEKADVFVQNLRPGDAEKMGLGYKALKGMMNERKPGENRGEKLIYASISGYGSDGPYAHKKAYDLLIQAEAGVLSITGTEGDNGMAKVGCSIADTAAGMYAYSNILGAIIQRQNTGKGCELDISMLESLVEWMGFPMYYAHEGQSGPKRAGASHASIYPYGPFSTGGGGKVMLGVQNEREWKTLATQVLDREDLTVDPKFRNTASRSENRDELEALISGIFAQWDTDEVTRRLEDAGIANAKVNDMHGVWDHPQLQARRRWRDVDSEVGPIKALIAPGTTADVEARMDKIPEVGEHNDSILRELGFQ
ncbi:CoA-transferase family III domain-containing protein [Exophiala viscosa]|uniref:CoA-transferase family III domain-containing protein n=1 Tax=Exophiala viscosa TaxID=2486360 RepID=A0AAN6IIM0_9EURO|nr:CoA-transferase family III domain-containing protein [Exophiala viscosa]